MESLIVLAVLTLFVRVGQAMLDAGNARAKNAASAVFRNVIDVCVGTLAFWVIGVPLIHTLNTHFSLDPSDPAQQFGPTTLFLYLVLALIVGGIFAGSIAERSKLIVAYVGSILAIGILFPITAHLVWFGWLKRIGFIDIGGAGAIHLSGAMLGLAAAILVGPRTSKFNKDGSSNSIPGHWLTLLGLGAFFTIIGWIGYLRLTTFMRDAIGADVAPINVMLAFAAGGVASLVLAQIRYGKPDVILTVAGAVGGLVAISATGGTLQGTAVIVTGIVAGILVQFSMTMLDMRMRVDDPSGAIAIHGVGGLWGLVAAGLFGPETSASRVEFIGVQLLGAGILIVIALVMGFVVFGILKAVVGLRITETDEFDGLDLAEHDVNAYPDFQQTMIKSYHLRET